MIVRKRWLTGIKRREELLLFFFGSMAAASALLPLLCSNDRVSAHQNERLMILSMHWDLRARNYDSSKRLLANYSIPLCVTRIMMPTIYQPRLTKILFSYLKGSVTPIFLALELSFELLIVEPVGQNTYPTELVLCEKQSVVFLTHVPRVSFLGEMVTPDLTAEIEILFFATKKKELFLQICPPPPLHGFTRYYMA
jgi:hypothetical protein